MYNRIKKYKILKESGCARFLRQDAGRKAEEVLVNATVVERRRAILINAAYFALILAVFYLIFKTFFSLLVPFLVAFVVGALLHRPVTFLAKKTPLNRSVSSAVCVLLILAVLGTIIFFLGSQIVDRVRGFYSFLTAKLQNFSEVLEAVRDWVLSLVALLPETMRGNLGDSVTHFFDSLIKNGFQDFSLSNFSIDWSSLLSKGVGGLKNTVVQIPSVLIAIVISVVACVFVTVDYDRLKQFVVRQVPDRYRRRLHDGKTLALSTLKSMGKAYSLILLITMTELTVGFYILKWIGIFQSDYIILLAFVIAIIDIIPVLGTGTVLIPWAVYCFVTGSFSLGLGLILIYAIILVIRQVIEPRLVAGQVGLPPIVTIISMYIGTKTIGVLGFFILPFVVILIKKFNDEGIIHLFRLPEKEEEAGGAPEETPEETPAEETADLHVGAPETDVH